jgi:hypothetical protein
MDAASLRGVAGPHRGFAAMETALCVTTEVRSSRGMRCSPTCADDLIDVSSLERKIGHSRLHGFSCSVSEQFTRHSEAGRILTLRARCRLG